MPKPWTKGAGQGKIIADNPRKGDPVEKGDYVAYIAQNGGHTLYLVLAVDSPKVSVRVVSDDMTVGPSMFTTDLIKIRRLWLQPDDEVAYLGKRMYVKGYTSGMSSKDHSVKSILFCLNEIGATGIAEEVWLSKEEAARSCEFMEELPF